MPRAHLVHLLSSFGTGAAQLRLAGLIGAWGDGYRHTIVALDRRTEARDLIPAALDVGVIGPLGGRPSPVMVRRLLGLLRPDLLLVDGDSLALATFAAWRRPGPPPVLVMEGPGAVPRRGGGRLMLRRLMRRAGPLVAPDPALRRPLARALDITEKQVTVIADGARVDDLPSGPPLPGLDRRPGEIVLGALLPPHGRHRLDRVLLAFAHAPHRHEARLAVIGEGADRERLETVAEQAGIADRVLLPGHVGDPTATLGEVDLFAVAPESEGVPAGLLDAMARGLPVIGCGDPSCAALVGPPNRDFIVAPSGAAALTSRLDALLRSSQLRRHLGWVNREHAARRPFTRTARAWGELVDECLTANRR